ncbi:MAG: ABC transporter ATP-binding protein [Methanofollis sp.]|uniref:ABC transporter ATP-binding protein n=1 Tax=Methanomicrobiaceae TaxID=2194 RepID=UPI0026287D6E|nr:ABC transporter ATP-binding protein [Methanofollis sp.]MCE5337868.1 ABC transporter ATP-binding protein [Methanomicrobiaceae archaeon]MDD4256167.1 ABC transporter ATP-binding protein [Methanofollis sp.]
MRMGDTLLCVRGLKVGFPTADGVVKASDTVDLTIRAGETLALLGETGSGKTVLGMAILRLLQPNTRIEGEILYRGRDLLSLPQEEMQKVRGREIAVVLQNSGTSLNPVLRVGDQIAEAITLHRGLKGAEAEAAAVDLLDRVRIAEPARMAREYPHRFSGGMRERALIALALACNPSFLIADEPTRGLDAVTKREILALFSEINLDRSVLFITHDIEAAATLAARVAVMYAGEIVEIGPVDTVLSSPAHPYTRGLLESLPARGMRPIPGSAPSLITPPPGCRFSPRCSCAVGRCEIEHPGLVRIGSGHCARCMLYD